MNAELVAALRETPTVARHLHVPLQSGDDGVLRAMGRRYTAATYLRRLEGLDDFNLTSDAIVGFPAEDERAFERTLEVVARRGADEGARLPVLAAARTPARLRTTRCRRRRRRSAAHGCGRSRTRPAARAGESKIGREDVVLVDRPGRGYGDDYSPWLVDGAGRRARSRARRRGHRRGDPRCLTTASSAGSSQRRRPRAPRRRVRGDPGHRARRRTRTCSSIPERHVETFREVDESPPAEAKRMLDFVAETARVAGLDDYA